MKYSAISLRHGTKGLATLIVSIFLVLLAAIVVFAVSRVMLTEHRMSSNEIRYRQAHEAASAGLDFAVAYMSTPSGADKVNNTTGNSPPDDLADILTINPTNLTTGSSYQVEFCDPRQPLTEVSCPSQPTNGVKLSCPTGIGCSCRATPSASINTPRILACGWSDDNLGRVRIVQGVGTVGGPGPGSVPPNPLTSKGAVNVSGSATVTNYYSNLTIWSGNPLSSIGNAGKTFVRNPNVPPPTADTPPPEPPTSCSTTANYVCMTDKNTTGADVIASDPTLNPTLNPNLNLFASLFGFNTVDEYIAAKKITPVNGANATEVNSLANVRGEIIVVRGPLTQNMNFTVGSRNNPVVLIVDGDWSGGGNTVINGLVYVSGSIDLQGSKTIYGSTVVEGAVGGTGSLDLIYDPFISNNDDGGIANIGRKGVVPSSWRDW